jgi:hypothetical protein
MNLPGRRLSFFALGVLALLVAGAMILSLATAPPNADQQVRTAAQNTVAASSFKVVETIRSRSKARVGSYRAIVWYQNPQKVMVMAFSEGDPVQPGEIVRIIGTTGWSSFDGGRTWEALGSRTGLIVRPYYVGALKRVLRVLTGASGVTEERDHFELTRHTTIGTSTWQVTVDGEFVHTVVIRGMLHFGRSTLSTVSTQSYSRVNDLSSIVPPRRGTVGLSRRAGTKF